MCIPQLKLQIDIQYTVELHLNMCIHHNKVMELIGHIIQMFKCHSFHLVKHLVNVLKSQIQKNICQNIQVIIKVPQITIIFLTSVLDVPYIMWNTNQISTTVFLVHVVVDPPYIM